MKRHLTNIFNKLGVGNRLELALFALNHNLLPPAASAEMFPDDVGCEIIQAKSRKIELIFPFPF